MTEYAPHLCEPLARSLDEPEVPLEYDDRMREYSIVSTGGWLEQMSFCPYCGARLPVSVRREFVRRLRARGLDPWDEQVRPTEFRTGEWWRKDPAFEDPDDDGYAITPVDIRTFVLASGLDGPVRLLDVLNQGRELSDFLGAVTLVRVALLQMLRAGEIDGVRDARAAGGRWSHETDVATDRLSEILRDDGPATAAMLPGLDSYETLAAISFETSSGTRAEAEDWVHEHRELWDMIVADR